MRQTHAQPTGECQMPLSIDDEDLLLALLLLCLAQRSAGGAGSGAGTDTAPAPTTLDPPGQAAPRPAAEAAGAVIPPAGAAGAFVPQAQLRALRVIDRAGGRPQ